MEPKALDGRMDERTDSEGERKARQIKAVVWRGASRVHLREKNSLKFFEGSLKVFLRKYFGPEGTMFVDFRVNVVLRWGRGESDCLPCLSICVFIPHLK